MFVKDSKDMGIQLNASFVGNDKDGYTAGAHVVTSDGIDISNEIKGDCIDDAIQKLVAGLIKEALLSSVANKKEEPKEDTKAKKVRELEDKLLVLSEEIDEVHSRMVELEDRYRDLDSEYDAVEDELYALEAKDDEEESRPTLDDILDFDGDFLDYINSLLK